MEAWFCQIQSQILCKIINQRRLQGNCLLVCLLNCDKNHRCTENYYHHFLVGPLVYALVRFENENCNAVVPVARIQGMDSLSCKEGDQVMILWDNRKEYDATFILSG